MKKPVKPSTEIGMRFNDDKPQLNYVLTGKHALAGLAAVMQYGATKYSRNNWRKGLPHTEIVDSMMRHLAAYVSGENNDPESGLPHIDHILCNAFFLAEIARTKPELDNREGV
jgi:hypothetical protein